MLSARLLSIGPRGMANHQNRLTASFLTIPTECRLRIYNHLFADAQYEIFPCTTFVVKTVNLKDHWKLLTTCKKIHGEAESALDAATTLILFSGLRQTYWSPLTRGPRQNVWWHANFNRVRTVELLGGFHHHFMHETYPFLKRLIIFDLSFRKQWYVFNDQKPEGLTKNGQELEIVLNFKEYPDLQLTRHPLLRKRVRRNSASPEETTKRKWLDNLLQTDNRSRRFKILCKFYLTIRSIHRHTQLFTHTVSLYNIASLCSLPTNCEDRRSFLIWIHNRLWSKSNAFQIEAQRVYLRRYRSSLLVCEDVRRAFR